MHLSTNLTLFYFGDGALIGAKLHQSEKETLMETEKFITAIKEQLNITGMTASEVSRKAVNQKDALKRIFDGHQPSFERACKLLNASGLKFYIGPPRESATSQVSEPGASYSVADDEEFHIKCMGDSVIICERILNNSEREMLPEVKSEFIKLIYEKLKKTRLGREESETTTDDIGDIEDIATNILKLNVA